MAENEDQPRQLSERHDRTHTLQHPPKKKKPSPQTGLPSMIKIEDHMPDLDGPEKSVSGHVEHSQPSRASSSSGKRTGSPAGGRGRRVYKPKPSRIRPIHVALLEEPRSRPKPATSTTRHLPKTLSHLPSTVESEKTSWQETSMSKIDAVVDQSISDDSEKTDTSNTDVEANKSTITLANTNTIALACEWSSHLQSTLETSSSTDTSASRVPRQITSKKSRRKLLQKNLVESAPLPKVDPHPQTPSESSILSSSTKPPSLVSGLWEDLFMITTTYARSNSTSFRDFLHLCQEKKILEIFCGVSGLCRLLELTEIAISRCKDMWLEKLSLKRQVSWFYLLCVFVVYQPQCLMEYDERLVRIRVVESDWALIQEFLDNAARSDEFSDVLLLFKLMYRKKAFLHCFTPSPHGLENAYIQSFLKDTEKTGFLYSDVPFPRLSCSLQLQKLELERAVKEYCETKSNLLEHCSPESARNLSDLLSNVTPGFAKDLFAPLSSKSQDNHN